MEQIEPDLYDDFDNIPRKHKKQPKVEVFDKIKKENKPKEVQFKNKKVKMNQENFPSLIGIAAKEDSNSWKRGNNKLKNIFNEQPKQVDSSQTNIATTTISSTSIQNKPFSNVNQPSTTTQSTTPNRIHLEAPVFIPKKENKLNNIFDSKAVPAKKEIKKPNDKKFSKSKINYDEEFPEL